jgi:wobble nucleotide-excising tRNase
MIDRLELLRNIGQFGSVAEGAKILLKKLTLVYAENGRGKTTLAAILRSLGSGNPVPIVERRRLAASHMPHVVILPAGTNAPAVFQNGNWSKTLPDIAVFDDVFVSENVYAGLDVDADHRQNLHELILGAEGVSLNKTLQGHVAQIEEHNRALRIKGDEIPARIRGALPVEAFCALEERADIGVAIQEAQRNLAAATEAEAVRREPSFVPFGLPELDLSNVEAILDRDLPALESSAFEKVQAHLAGLGDGGEAWVAGGMSRIPGASVLARGEICPFCAQDLAGSDLITNYRAYFSDSYEGLKKAIAGELSAFRRKHSGEVSAAFERSVRVAVERRQFWSQFTDIPEIDLDTASIARKWKAAQELVISALVSKQASPLESISMPTASAVIFAEYRSVMKVVADLSESLQTRNSAITLVKEKASSSNVSALTTDLTKLQAMQARYQPEVKVLCDAYVAEKAEKLKTEELREKSRNALDNYRKSIFPAYEIAINDYLQKFIAGFRLTSVNSVNTRAGSACTYSVLINTIAVPLSVGTTPGPSFRNTLSAGDRNALALAFFFASLDRDPRKSQKTVVIDDPMTSLDEHRALTTVQEMRRLAASVDQVIVLSHSKSFLCALWKDADSKSKVAIKIIRDVSGSTLALWDVNQDSITEHDRRSILVRNYIAVGATPDVRTVAAALRPILEAFTRVAYPDVFPPGTLLGPFIGRCQQCKGTPQEILGEADIVELRDLLDYANRFHHDTNDAWETESINDAELSYFSRRTVAFTQRKNAAPAMRLAAKP